MRTCLPQPKNKLLGQSMVEFALVLPILLLITYGLLEVGRLVFIYSTVATATREAVRFGSATGKSSTGVPRYQDCAGIKNTAKKIGFLIELQDSDIINSYDHGPGTTTFDTCDGDIDTDVELANKDRIVVAVSGDYSPIVSLVPLEPFTFTSTSSRTVLMNILIVVTGLPNTSTPVVHPPTPTLTSTPTVTLTPTNTPTATWTPLYTPTPSNTPTNTPTSTNTPTPTLTYTPTNTPTPTYTPTPTNTPIPCDVRHGPLEVSSDSMSMTIYNNQLYETDETVTITQLEIWFNDDDSSQWWNQQGIRTIALGDNKIWNNTFSSDGDESLLLSQYPLIMQALGPTKTILSNWRFKKNTRPMVPNEF